MKGLRNLKKLDPKIIRVGDYVKIVNPDMFIRCGYPLSKMDMVKEVEEHFSKIIEDLAYSVAKGDVFVQRDDKGLYPGQKDNFIITPLSELRSRGVNREIIEALAVKRLFARDFGGNVRSIHTKRRSEFQGAFSKVVGIKFVKTGTRVSGFSSRSSYYDSEIEYSPPYLEHEKTHKILRVWVGNKFQDSNWDASCWSGHRGEAFIEATNVEKMYEKDLTSTKNAVE